MNVPVIDISGFKAGSEPERRAIAAQVDRAASDVGFMQIAGHGIPTTAVLHWKPARSVVPETPDVHAVTTDAWVVYPFKAGG